MQVRVGWYEYVLMVSDIVGDGGWRDVGQLGSGYWQAAVVIHRD